MYIYTLLIFKCIILYVYACMHVIIRYYYLHRLRSVAQDKAIDIYIYIYPLNIFFLASNNIQEFI